MKYTVFDLDINKLWGVFDTMDEAVAYVRAILSANTDDYADDLGIIPRTELGEYGESISGDGLRRCVKEHAARREGATTTRTASAQSYGAAGSGCSGTSADNGIDSMAASGRPR